MSNSIFSRKQREQVRYVENETLERGYGISLDWLDRGHAVSIREELKNAFSLDVAYRQYDFADALLLPPITSVMVMELGALAMKDGLRPSQIGITTQVPREIGPGHFDRNARMSLVVPLNTSEVHMHRPGHDGLPNLHEDGTPIMDDTHGLVVPARSLVGFGGPLTEGNATFHRVGNPSDNDRYSIAIAFV
jgi:hypothetical protein